MKRFILAAGVATFALGAAQAGVIGKMTPAAPLTVESVAGQPAAEQAAWRAYLARSQAAHQLDVETLAAERASSPVAGGPAEGKQGTAKNSMPLDRAPAWYASPEARHIADVIVSFQTPAGGWSKNSDRSGPLRAKGEAYGGGEGYIGTFDNDATIGEMRFLAKVIGQVGDQDGRAYRASFSRGVDYVLASQYPNGGWPQVWPLQGGYHDAVTFNDGAMLAAARLLGDIAEGKPDFTFVDQAQRGRAKAGWSRALDCILAAQIRIGGKPMGWSQQHEALGLAATGARNFEPAALSSSETGEILVYLMGLQRPGPNVTAAIEGGVAWLKASVIRDKAWTPVDPAAGRKLIDKPGAPPLWSRYYDIATGAPIFGDRDRTIHDDVNDLSVERRNGYAWFNSTGQKVLATYETWSRQRKDAGGARAGEAVSK